MGRKRAVTITQVQLSELLKEVISTLNSVLILMEVLNWVVTPTLVL